MQKGRLLMEKNVIETIKDEYFDDLKECNTDKTDCTAKLETRTTELHECEGTTPSQKGTTETEVINAGVSLIAFVFSALVTLFVGIGIGLFIKRKSKGTKSGDEEAHVEDTQYLRIQECQLSSPLDSKVFLDSDPYHYMSLLLQSCRPANRQI